jgi:hypothetical protein
MNLDVHEGDVAGMEKVGCDGTRCDRPLSASASPAEAQW